ncbi:MAG: NAD+ kinase [Bdellovibrionia bacterium]
MPFEKAILVTKKTRLEELVIRFGSERQARFYIERNDQNFDVYAQEHSSYKAALELVRPALASFDELKLQMLDRSLVKSYLFNQKDIIVALGPDGLVANTAKYVGQQPIVAVNPDPERIDGILLPFRPDEVKRAVQLAVRNDLPVRNVTLGEAILSDGQKLLAFNDFFIGARTHVSARYRICFGKADERQSSSGVIVSTGAGSTGWLSSVINMASGISSACGGRKVSGPKLAWNERKLVFAVREPFVSKSSQAETTFGLIDSNRALTIESQMPLNGVIFSDGVEDDLIHFNSGARVTIKPAAHQAALASNPKS